MSGSATQTQTSSKRSAWFLVGGLLVALVMAGVVSNFASGSPDGLDSVLRDGCTFDENDQVVAGTCGAQAATDHELADSPLADYGVSGVDNSFVSTGLSGVIGVLVTLALGAGVFALLRSRKSKEKPSQDGG